MKLTEKESSLLKELVEKIEKDTSGEVVPLVARRSSPPGFLPDWMTGFSVLLVITLIWIYEKNIDFPLALDTGLFWLSVFVVVFTVLLHLPAFQRRLLGAEASAHFVEDRALAEFMRHGLTNTRARTGVLIFVSILEHKIQIIADQGISAKVAEAEWKAISDRTAGLLRKGHLYEALALALSEIGPLLKTHFPRSPGDGDTNELSDEVRVLK